jgi:hypothetical protein
MRAAWADRLARRSQWAVHVLRSGADAVSPLRAARALRSTIGDRSRGRLRPEAEHPEWIEQRFACDPGVAAAARHVVGEVLSGRVTPSVVKRAELVISELVADAMRRTAESAGEVVVRLARQQDGCRLEVETGGRLPTSDLACVHVVPDERTATWHVYDADMAVGLSEHATETEAEAIAGVCARIRGAPRVVIHDRYHRTREAAIAGGGSMPVRRPRRGRNRARPRDR